MLEGISFTSDLNDFFAESDNNQAFNLFKFDFCSTTVGEILIKTGSRFCKKQQLTLKIEAEKQCSNLKCILFPK